MDERLRALAGWLPRLQEPGFHIGEWAGGEKLASGPKVTAYARTTRRSPRPRPSS